MCAVFYWNMIDQPGYFSTVIIKSSQTAFILDGDEEKLNDQRSTSTVSCKIHRISFKNNFSLSSSFSWESQAQRSFYPRHLSREGCAPNPDLSALSGGKVQLESLHYTPTTSKAYISIISQLPPFWEFVQSFSAKPQETTLSMMFKGVWLTERFINSFEGVQQASYIMLSHIRNSCWPLIFFELPGTLALDGFMYH